MTLTDLSDLNYQAKCKKHPTVPIHAVPRTKYSDKNANGLTNAICDYIRLTGNYADRINNMGVMRNGRMTRSGTRRGIADIMASKAGRMVAIEVKIGRDRQSDDQKKIQAEVERSGAVYILAKTWAGFYQDWTAI